MMIPSTTVRYQSEDIWLTRGPSWSRELDLAVSNFVMFGQICRICYDIPTYKIGMYPRCPRPCTPVSLWWDIPLSNVQNKRKESSLQISPRANFFFIAQILRLLQKNIGGGEKSPLGMLFSSLYVKEDCISSPGFHVLIWALLWSSATRPTDESVSKDVWILWGNAERGRDTFSYFREGSIYLIGDFDFRRVDLPTLLLLSLHFSVPRQALPRVPDPFQGSGLQNRGFLGNDQR